MTIHAFMGRYPGTWVLLRTTPYGAWLVSVRLGGIKPNLIHHRYDLQSVACQAYLEACATYIPGYRQMRADGFSHEEINKAFVAMAILDDAS